jgi:hypothetical protein
LAYCRNRFNGVNLELNLFIMFTEELTREAVSTKPRIKLEVLEIVCVEKGDYCSSGQEGHEFRAPSGEILVCANVNGEYKWVGTGRGI